MIEKHENSLKSLASQLAHRRSCSDRSVVKHYSSDPGAVPVHNNYTRAGKTECAGGGVRRSRSYKYDSKTNIRWYAVAPGGVESAEPFFDSARTAVSIDPPRPSPCRSRIIITTIIIRSS